MRYNEQFIVETLHLIGVIFFYVSYRGQKALQINIYIYIAKKLVVVCVWKEEYYHSICADFICIL